MSTAPLDTAYARSGLPDVPLIVEDLLCQIEDFRGTDGSTTTVAELWAQVDLLQGR